MAAPSFPDSALPGVSHVDDALEARLRSALASKPTGYTPRTHHLRADGSPEYVNRLIEEGSPYLLQHAHNPVNWQAFGEEAFERARALDLPVLLSVGYSTCHWCHVMERESFEDVEIAAYINANYVAIKVDREERPDVDAIYMTAVQALTGHGGWPMTVVTTPDQKPFFAGTYYPARDGDRGNHIGFYTVLRELRERYSRERERIVHHAEEITAHLRKLTEKPTDGSVPTPQAMAQLAAGIKRMYDETYGGFGGAPKFPQPARLRQMLRHARRHGDRRAQEMVHDTLVAMARGGMYDQVGGGFHRYSVDAKWLVPHFEKMLYDNAQLVTTYLEAYQLTGAERLADVARDILEYLAREMRAPTGGFYSATDADSLTPEGESDEGYYFTWTREELDSLLDDETARIVKHVYGTSDIGNFEGRNIFFRSRSDEEDATALGLPVEKLQAVIAQARVILLEARNQRPTPIRDDKQLTEWNGLAISAFALASFVLAEEKWLTIAEEAMSFVLETMLSDGRLRHSYLDGKAQIEGYLEDYAFTVTALLDLHQATAETTYLETARMLQGVLDDGFAAEHGGYFRTSEAHPTLLMREQPDYDGAIPTGNSATAMNLARLYALTGDTAYRERAEGLFKIFGRNMQSGGLSLMACAFDAMRDPQALVIVGNARESLLDATRRTFAPSVALVAGDAELIAKNGHIAPVCADKVAQTNTAFAYLCHEGRCENPTDSAETLRAQLSPLGSKR